MTQPFPIAYTWTDADGTHHGYSVNSAETQEEAEREFFRRNPHVKPVEAEKERAA